MPMIGIPPVAMSPWLRSLGGMGKVAAGSVGDWSLPFLSADVENDESLPNSSGDRTPIIRSSASQLLQYNNKTGEIRKIGKPLYAQFKPTQEIGVNYREIHGIGENQGIRVGSAAYQRWYNKFQEQIRIAGGRFTGHNFSTDMKKYIAAGMVRPEQFDKIFDTFQVQKQVLGPSVYKGMYNLENTARRHTPTANRINQITHNGFNLAHTAADAFLLQPGAVAYAASLDPHGFQQFLSATKYNPRSEYDMTPEEAAALAAARGKPLGEQPKRKKIVVKKKSVEQQVAEAATTMSHAVITDAEGNLDGFNIVTGPADEAKPPTIRERPGYESQRRKDLMKRAGEGTPNLWNHVETDIRNSEYYSALNKAFRMRDENRMRELVGVGKLSDTGFISFDGSQHSWDTLKDKYVREDLTRRRRETFDSAVDRVQLGYIRRGRETDAAAIASMVEDGSVNDIVSLARAQAELNQAYRDQLRSVDDNANALRNLKQERKAAMQVMGKFGDTHGEWYDWTRWHSARTSQWSGIQAAGAGILPKWIERPIRHLGDAYITGQWGQNWKLMGAQRAFQQGVMPIAAGLTNAGMGMSMGRMMGGFGASVAGGTMMGSMAGPWGMIIGGALGAVQGITQIIGNIGEARIQQRGFDIQSKLHLVNAGIGLFKDIHGMIHRIIMTPLKLLGNVIKWSIPIFVGLAETIRQLIGSNIRKTESLIGRPNLAYTTDMTTATGRNKGWRDYIWSRGADLRTGLSDGTTQSLMEDMVRRQHSLLLGAMPLQQTGLVSAALLGNINDFFGSWQVGDKDGAWQHFNSMISSLTAGGPNSRTLNMIREAFGPEIETMVSTVWDAQARNPKITNVQDLLDNAGAGSRIGQALNKWAEMLGDINQYRDTSTEYGIINNIRQYQQMRIANSAWNAVGRSMEIWWIKFLERLENKDFKGAGRQILGGAAEVFSFVKDIVGGTVSTLITELIGVPDGEGGMRMPTLREGWDTIKGKLLTVIPAIVDLYVSAWITIADAGYRIIRRLADTIWNSFYSIIDQFNDLKFDWRKILTGDITGGISWNTAKGTDIIIAAGAAAVARPGLWNTAPRAWIEQGTDLSVRGDIIRTPRGQKADAARRALLDMAGIDTTMMPGSNYMLDANQQNISLDAAWNAVYMDLLGRGKDFTGPNAGANHRRAIDAMISMINADKDDNRRTIYGYHIAGRPVTDDEYIEYLRGIAPTMFGQMGTAINNYLPESIRPYLETLRAPATDFLENGGKEVLNLIDMFIDYITDLNNPFSGFLTQIKRLVEKADNNIDKSSTAFNTQSTYTLRAVRHMESTVNGTRLQPIGGN